MNDVTVLQKWMKYSKMHTVTFLGFRATTLHYETGYQHAWASGIRTTSTIAVLIRWRTTTKNSQVFRAVQIFCVAHHMQWHIPQLCIIDESTCGNEWPGSISMRKCQFQVVWTMDTPCPCVFTSAENHKGHGESCIQLISWWTSYTVWLVLWIGGM